jgi:hypothetical protein
MSRKEVPRPGLLKVALAGTFTNGEGARALHLSIRLFRRGSGHAAGDSCGLGSLSSP